MDFTNGDPTNNGTLRFDGGADIDLIAVNMVIDSSAVIDAGAGTVTLIPMGFTTTMDLRGPDVAPVNGNHPVLGVTQDELDTIKAWHLIVEGTGFLGNLPAMNAITVTTPIVSRGDADLLLSAWWPIILYPGSSLTTRDGDITLRINEKWLEPGNFAGITVAGATIRTTGSGNILLQGHGGDEGSDNDGIDIYDGSVVQTLGTGTVTLHGTGGPGTEGNFGVWISDAGTRVSTAGGELSITGLSDGNGADNRGIQVQDGAVVSTDGSGRLTLNGTGGLGTEGNSGVRLIDDARVTSSGGALTITGAARDPHSEGVIIVGPARLNADPDTDLTVTGTSLLVAEDSQLIVETGKLAVSTSGRITLDGTIVADNSFALSAAGGVVVTPTGTLSGSGTWTATDSSPSGTSMIRSTPAWSTIRMATAGSRPATCCVPSLRGAGRTRRSAC